MSNPVITAYGGAFIYYTCDRDPTNNEPLTYNNLSDLLMLWWNTTNKTLFWCLDQTAGAMVWVNCINSNNISSYIPSIPVSISDGGTGATTVSGIKSNLGLNINTTRAPSSVSLSFNTSRQPNTTHDVFVSCNILFSSVLSLSDEVDIQISPDNSSWTSFGQQKQQLSLAANIINQLIAYVPAGYYYKLIRVSGSNSTINSIYEITM